jgi:hypothetical protein
MFRLTFGLAALLIAALSVPLLVIRAQPHDNSELRTFLTPPDDCAAPCFMGVRPGVMTAGEALNILERHDWVESVDIMQTPIRWTWSGRQPGWIDERVPGALATERFVDRTRHDAAVRLVVQSRLALADVYLLLGPPDLSWFRLGYPASVVPPVHAVYYRDYGLQLSSANRCPLRLDNIWRESAELSFLIVPSRLPLVDPTPPLFPMAGAGWQRPAVAC